MKNLILAWAVVAIAGLTHAETNSPSLSPREFLKSIEPKRTEFNAAVTRFAQQQSRWPTNTLELTEFATQQLLPLDLSIYSSVDFTRQQDGGLRVVFGYAQFAQKEVRSFRIGTETVNIHADPHTKEVRIEKVERRDSVPPEDMPNTPSHSGPELPVPGPTIAGDSNTVQMASNQTVPREFTALVIGLAEMTNALPEKPLGCVIDTNAHWRLTLRVFPHDRKAPFMQGIRICWIKSAEDVFGTPAAEVDGEYRFSYVWNVMVPGRPAIEQFKARRQSPQDPPLGSR